MRRAPKGIFPMCDQVTQKYNTSQKGEKGYALDLIMKIPRDRA